jgi:hypothetical protein
MQKRLLDLYDHPPAELLAELEGKNGKRKAGEAQEDEESAPAVETSGAPPVKGTTP